MPLLWRRFILSAAILALVWFSRECGFFRPESESAVSSRRLTEGRVIRVHDGDTISFVDGQGREIKARLWGVDAPELAQAGGQASLNFLLSLAGQGSRIKIEEVEYDRYDRLVAKIYLADGRSLNREMVAAGQAWVYERYCTTAECRAWQDDQKAAQRGRLGLWAGGDLEKPWLWRRSHLRN